MSTSKLLVIAALAIAIGGASGSFATYIVLTKRHQTEVRVNTASLEYLRAADILEQMALLEHQDVPAAKTKLNYRLAGLVYDAQMFAKNPGEEGRWFEKILAESAEQRKQPAYKIEEEKVVKELAEFKLVPMKFL